MGSDEQSQLTHLSLEKSKQKQSHLDRQEHGADEQMNKENVNAQGEQLSHTCEGFNRQVEEKPRKGGKAGLKQLLSLEVNNLFDDSTAHFDDPAPTTPKPLVSPRSQVEDDLDALFHSNKEVVHFDSNDLERELDGILF